MKLIIDIDKETYENCKAWAKVATVFSEETKAIANGIPYCESKHTKELVNYLYENHVSGDLSIEDMAGDILNLTKGDLVDE